MVSSHVLADLEQMADRVVFVDRGVSVGERSIDDLARASGPRVWRLRALNQPELVAALDRNHTPLSAVGVDVELLSDEAAAGLIVTPSAKSMLSFALLIAVLAFRPQGLFGRRL